MGNEQGSGNPEDRHAELEAREASGVPLSGDEVLTEEDVKEPEGGAPIDEHEIGEGLTDLAKGNERLEAELTKDTAITEEEGLREQHGDPDEAAKEGFPPDRTNE